MIFLLRLIEAEKKPTPMVIRKRNIETSINEIGLSENIIAPKMTAMTVMITKEKKPKIIVTKLIQSASLDSTLIYLKSI